MPDILNLLLRNSASSFHWLSSSIFTVCSVVRPASVTPPLISTIWCFRPYKPYIFCEDMILATCHCHLLSIHCWVEPSCLVASCVENNPPHVYQVLFNIDHREVNNRRWPQSTRHSLYQSCLWRFFFSIFSTFGFHPWWPWGRCDEIHGISLGIIGDDRGRRYEIFVDNWAFVGSLNLNELLKERMWPLYDDK